jgi:hypothetical protein
MLASCDGDDCCTVTPDAAAPGDTGSGGDRVEVARVPAVANNDVDLLFVVDDSVSTLDLQTNLKTAFPAFTSELAGAPGGLPSLHIGVVSPDLGTKAVNDATPAPSFGGSTGGCFNEGKAGNLLSSSSVQGAFISDVKNSDGTRVKNYVGTLESAFSTIASLGATGCGFEQPIEAARRALDGNPANAGFLRPDAVLGIVVVTDEDDCSASHATLFTQDTETLGPLQSFRCTRFGVTCDVNGSDPDEMNQPNVKDQCHSNEGSTYLMPMGPYATFFTGLKARADDVLFAAIIGDVTPVEVVMRSPPGSEMAIPALASSCHYASTTGTAAADPGIRIAELANEFARHSIGTACMQDLSGPLVALAHQVRMLTGDSCVGQAIALPADCTARDEAGATSTPLPACDNGASSTNKPCFELITDPASCSAGSHLRLEVRRATSPPPGTVTVLSCKV